MNRSLTTAALIASRGVLLSAQSQDIPLVMALCAFIIGLYGTILMLDPLTLRLPTNISTLAAMAAAAPAAPFAGPAVLGDLFGGASSTPIAIGSLAINLTVVRTKLLLLSLKTVDGDLPGTTVVAKQAQVVAARAASDVALAAAPTKVNGRVLSVEFLSLRKFFRMARSSTWNT